MICFEYQLFLPCHLQPPRSANRKQASEVLNRYYNRSVSFFERAIYRASASALPGIRLSTSRHEMELDRERDREAAQKRQWLGQLDFGEDTTSKSHMIPPYQKVAVKTDAL